MFWKLFKQRRKEIPSPTWLGFLQATTRVWGLRISRWLQRKTMTLSPIRLKLYVASFLLLFGSWNGWIVYHALYGRHYPIPAGQLSLSHPTLPTVRPPIDPSSLAGIQHFRSWLDSLQKDSAGRQIYDSIRRQRPGLLDSLGQLEKSDFIHH